MEWRQFVMNLGPLPPAAVEELFAKHGALAVTLSDAGDTPILEPEPGQTPLWRNTEITGLFPAALDFDRLARDLRQTFDLEALPPSRLETLKDRIWEREWLKDARPMRFGRRLWVCPGELDVARDVAEDQAVVVRLDPGLAFGTGSHASTALCLEWLEGLDTAGRRVLDFGCGSGILSIAALLLGARDATAVDIDPQAIQASRENARRNAVELRLRTTLDADTLDRDFDVVVANILAGPLIRHAETLCGALVRGGRIALAGILDHQRDEVRRAYDEWIDFEAPAMRPPWARLTGTRR